MAGTGRTHAGVPWHARVTMQRHLVPVVVCVQDKAMQEPWCVVSSRHDLKGVAIKVADGRRFTVEETFRDVKNPRLGLGLTQAVIARHDRRDALFLLAVLAHTLLTVLGKARQELGMGVDAGSDATRTTVALPPGADAFCTHSQDAGRSPSCFG